MSNMSYCRFENTVSDLNDCVGALENYNEEMNQLSRDEQHAVCHLAIHAVEVLAKVRDLIEDKTGTSLSIEELIDKLEQGNTDLITEAINRIG